MNDSDDSDDRDDRLEREIRAAFERSRLPAAPVSLRTRVADLASQPATHPATSRPPLLALFAAAVVLAALVGTAVLVGSRTLLPLQSPAATVGTLPSAVAPSPGATSIAIIVTPPPGTMAPTPVMTAGPTPPPTAAATGPAFEPPGTMQLFVADQPTSGDGWRILGGAARLAGPPYDGEKVELYTGDGVLKPLDFLGLPPGSGGVDRAHDVVAVADILVGDATGDPFCGRIQLDAVTFDATNRTVTLRYRDAFTGLQRPTATPQPCDAIGIPARFMVALSIDHLPASPFSLRLVQGTRQIAEATNLSAPIPPSPSDATLVDAAGTFPKGGLWVRQGRTLWTMDSGMETPEEEIELPIDPIDVDVEDPAAVRVVSAGPGSTLPYADVNDVLHLLVSATNDAGRTWTTTAIDGNFGGMQPVLRFESPSSGYLLLASFRGGPDSRFFVTSDGGATWTERTALLKSSAGPAVPGYLGAIFSVGPGANLWAGSQGDAGPVGRPILDVSRDGGDTWTDARLPGLVGDIMDTDHVLAPPVFFGVDGVVAVSIEGETAVTTRIFTTADGGQTWTRSGITDGAPDETPFTALSERNWYLESSGGLMITGNAGQTWHAAGPPLEVGQIEWLGFEDDPNRGFAIVDVRGDPYTNRLYATRDGGASWAPAVLVAP